MLFNLRREHVDTANNQHVIRSAGNLGDSAHNTLRTRQQASEVARAVANDWERLLGEAGENQFALGIVGQHLTRFRIDNLGIEVIFPNGRTVFAIDKFLRNTRTHHLGQSINIRSIDTASSFNGAAHGIGPWLGPEDAQS